MRILNGESKSNAWRNHPAVLMWREFLPALCEYGRIVCVEWRERGYTDNLLDKFPELDVEYPSWLGNAKLHLSHQSNLIRKFPEHYKLYFPNVPDNLPYYWVTKEQE